MLPIILHHKDEWWTIYDKEKETVITNEKYRDYYNSVIKKIEQTLR
jgi:hypothetical protein